MAKKEYGVTVFHNQVDITDPPYDRNVWCRKTVNTVPGTYHCYAAKNSEGRVASCEIILDGIEVKEGMWEEVCSVGVDTGLAGFFDGKPDFPDKDWRKFYNRISQISNSASEENDGVYLTDFAGCNSFFTSSGWGDGSYPVYGVRDVNGNYVALRILFIEEEEEAFEDKQVGQILNDLTIEQKRLLFFALENEFDKADARMIAENFFEDADLDDDDIEVIAKRYRDNYDWSASGYDQMISTIEEYLKERED